VSRINLDQLAQQIAGYPLLRLQSVGGFGSRGRRLAGRRVMRLGCRLRRRRRLIRAAGGETDEQQAAGERRKPHSE
jgi:hypothetical protein